MEGVGRQLSWTAKEARAVLDQRLQAVGGSLPIWLILHALVDHDGNVQRQLADALCIEGPTMTRHLDRMESEGLIERRPDPADRRVTRIYATDEGRTMLKTLWAVTERSEHDLLRGMSRQEVDALMSLLGRVRDNVWSAALADAAQSGRPAPRRPLVSPV
jgi:MarR family transcriptional regulator, transcriptional regulator for hemolysin